MDQLRFGIIGAGIIAAGQHFPSIRDDNRARLVSVCRRSEDKLKMAQEAFGAEEGYSDWREMIEKSNLDAVSICTPHDLHAEQSIAALNHGLHVLLEKPMTIKGEDARALLEAEKSSGRVLMVAYDDRFKGKWRTAKSAIEDGMIGQLRQVNLALTIYRRFQWEDKTIPDSLKQQLLKMTGMPEEFIDLDLSDNWHFDPARVGGGAFNNAGAHWTNLALWLAGSHAVEVSAMTAPENQEVEYFVSALARLANGVQFALTFADAVPGRAQARLTLTGDDGILTYDHTDGAIHVYLGPRGKEVESGYKEVEPEYKDISAVENFINCILDGDTNLSPANESANAVYFTEAVYKSARTHKICEL